MVGQAHQPQYSGYHNNGCYDDSQYYTSTPRMTPRALKRPVAGEMAPGYPPRKVFGQEQQQPGDYQHPSYVRLNSCQPINNAH